VRALGNFGVGEIAHSCRALGSGIPSSDSNGRVGVAPLCGGPPAVLQARMYQETVHQKGQGSVNSDRRRQVGLAGHPEAFLPNKPWTGHPPDY